MPDEVGPGPAPPRRGRAPGLKVPRWTPTEDELLKQLVGIHGLKAWNTVAADLEKGGGAPLRSGTAVEQHYQILMGKRRRSGASMDKGDDTDALGAPLDAVGRAERAAEAAERAARLSEDKMLRREEKEAEEAEKVAKRLERLARQERDAAEKELKRVEKERKRKEREEKDALPKKPRTCYLFYADETRQLLREQHPELPVTEIAKLQGEGWKGLTEVERQKYTDAATEDIERYRREMEEIGLPVELPVQAAKKPKEAKEASSKSRPSRSKEGEEGKEGGGKENPKPSNKGGGKADKKKKKVEVVEVAEEEEEETIEWYVPDGFSVQEEAPTAAQMEFGNDEGDALVGRHILFNWQGVGWCEGVIEERNPNPRIRLGNDIVNFWVYYALDNNMSRHVLDLDGYQWGAEAEDDSWVLLHVDAV